MSLAALEAHAQEDDIVSAEPEERTVSVSALVKSGAPELVFHSAAYGGVAGFLGAATALSATRISEIDSLPWLIGAPAFGILAGGAAAAVAAYRLPLDAGDAALVSSMLWTGSAWGFALQLLLFDERNDVGHIPLRFSTMLGSGLGVGALGAAAAWGLDIDPGDVGVLNSAALWGAVLGGLSWFTLGASGLIVLPPGDPIASFSTAVSVVLAASVLPWSAAFALHPFLALERPATWLIEAGGIAGVLSGLALTALFANAGFPSGVYPGMVTVTTGLGVAAGAAGAVLVSDVVRQFDLADFTTPLLSLSPAILPPAPGRDDIVPGLFAVVRF